MKLVRRDLDMHILCDRHRRVTDVVVSNVTYAAMCEVCRDFTLEDRIEEIMRAEESIAQYSRRLSQLLKGWPIPGVTREAKEHLARF